MHIWKMHDMENALHGKCTTWKMHDIENAQHEKGRNAYTGK